MAKRRTKTEIVTKALARSGPELRPDQIRLADEAQLDPNKVYTQSDLNQNAGSGGGGAIPDPIDLDGYAKTDYVDSADQALNTLIAANAQAIEDIDGYATEEWVTEQLAKPAREERLAFIESQFQYRGLMTLDADGKPEWPADQVKERGGWWAYPTSKYSSIWKYDKLEWIFPHYGEVRANGDTVSKTPAQGYQVGDIIRLEVTENEAGIYRDTRYVDTAPVFVEYKVEELYYPNKLDGNSNSYYPAYRVSMSGPLHRYSGNLPNEVVGAEAYGEEEWIQWYSTVMSYGTPVVRLPGYSWNCIDYPDSLVEGEGEERGSAPIDHGQFAYNADNDTFYISGITACGLLIATQSSSFIQYSIPAVMSIYDKEDGLCAFIKVGSIQLQAYGGQNYFRVERSGYAKQVLTAGKTYNITLSGVF